jgi:hypothetical protein
VDRALSTTTTQLPGGQTIDRSSGAMNDGTALKLIADATGVQYGVYVFGGVTAPQQLTVNLDTAATSAAWIGIADYHDLHWRFSGPFSSTQNLALSTDQLSPLGNVYVCIIAAPIATARVVSLALAAQGPPPRRLRRFRPVRICR